jgi:steroid 5-alpha reductase family enzyme
MGGEVGRAVAVGLFCAGFALEVLADWQLEEFKRGGGEGEMMCREGVWGVVRYPE